MKTTQNTSCSADPRSPGIHFSCPINVVQGKMPFERAACEPFLVADFRQTPGESLPPQMQSLDSTGSGTELPNPALDLTCEMW